MTTKSERCFEGFSRKTFAFLRDIGRHNDKAWFQAHRDVYEQDVLRPLRDLVSDLADTMLGIDLSFEVAPAVGKTISRIYRDTRFSPDKTPYKTHVAAIFPRNTAVKREGAVFYLHFTEKEVLAFGGVWGPDRDELMAYRTLLRDNYEEFEAILAGKSLRKLVGGLQGEQLTRMPKGFPVDHPAEGLLRQKQWYLESTLPINLLTTPRVVPELARRFAVMAPMVEFLNRPFAQKKVPKKMMFMAF